MLRRLFKPIVAALLMLVIGLGRIFVPDAPPDGEGEIPLALRIFLEMVVMFLGVFFTPEMPKTETAK